MPWTEESGVSLHFSVSGEGRSLVLLHELGGSLESWNGVVAKLPVGFRILRFDQRGAGRSEKVRQSFSLDEQVRDLQAVLHDAKMSEPLWIVAVAASAPIAIRFTEQNPDRVAGLVLCSPAIGVDEERRAYLQRRSEIAAEKGIRAVLDQTLDRSFPEQQVLDKEVYAQYRSMFLSNDPIAYGLANQALANAETSDLGKNVQVPCLVLGGELDQLRPPAAVQNVAQRIPGARFELVCAGHFMHVEQSSEIAERILSFMNENQPQDSVMEPDIFVEVQGLRFHCRITGKVGAPWIVFGNSLATNLDIWSDIAKGFSDKFRILRYNQRGHGLTEVPSKPCTFDVLTDDAIALMDHFKIESAIFIGVSMGAVTALRAAQRFPNRIRATIACDGQPSSPATNASIWTERIHQAQTNGMQSLVEPTIQRWFPKSFTDASVLDDVRRMIQTTPVEGYIANVHALLEYDFRADMAEIKIPILLLAGSEDGVLPAAMRALHETIPGSRFAEIEGAGHLPNIQSPSVVLHHIREFIDSLPAKGGRA